MSEQSIKKDTVRELYIKREATITQLAQQYDVPYKQIVDILKEMDIETPKKIEIDVNHLRELKRNGFGKKKLSDYYGITPMELYERLKEENLLGILSIKKGAKKRNANTVDANMDKCWNCRFRAESSALGNYCDYIGIMDAARNCSIIDCDKKELKKRGRPPKKKVEAFA